MLPFSLFLCLAEMKAVDSFPYFCGFETSEERAGWVFVNGGSDIKNKWNIGTATSFKGENSLYISSDGGTTVGYVDNACLVAAYREFDLPNGIFDVSFDWKVAGDSVNLFDVLRVCWIDDPEQPGDVYINIKENLTGGFPDEYARWEKAKLSSYSAWRNNTFSIRGGIKGRLVFFWVNNSDGIVHAPAACIDNIQIARQSVCDKPTSFVVGLDATKENIELSWQGTADKYELIYKNVIADQWDTIPEITGLNYSMPILSPGSYAFWLRGICDNDTSIWTPYYYLPVLDYQNICLDFTNLISPAIQGTTGKFTGADTPTHQRYAYENQGIVDYGEESGASRHTTNVTYGQYDANTGFALRTIPPGEFTSVRLGNWRTGSEAESLSFNYSVDSTSNILLLKYAVVLQDPGHEYPMEQPQFLLEILDQNDQLLDEECGKVYFYAKEGEDGWTTYKRNPEDNVSVIWKDWTTMGVNLTPYMGENIKIRLTTFDCSQGAHYGYAYFTMNCTVAELTGVGCGVEEVETVEAPEGFRYEWYDPAKPDEIVSTERVLDTKGLDVEVTYICKIISLEKEDCFFELKASLLPLNVKAEAEYKYVRENCENKVEFKSTSYVYTKRGKESREVDTYYWDFGNGQHSTDPNAVAYYTTPGKYTVTLEATLNDDEACSDIWTQEIEIIDIGPYNHTFYESICDDGEGFEFGAQTLFETGTYTQKFISTTGCDSVVTINLTVNECYNVSIVDTICSGQVYNLNGIYYDQSGSYSQRFESIHGCDSIVRLKLVVLPEVKFKLTAYPEIRGNDGRIVISNASYKYTYAINGEMNGDLEHLSAGEYTITLYNAKKCEGEPQTITVGLECLSLTPEEADVNLCVEDKNVIVPFALNAGYIDKYDVEYGDDAKAAGLNNIADIDLNGNDYFSIPVSDNVRPGHYTAYINFPEQLCEIEPIVVPFSILYPSSILSQRWEDVLFVQNADYNGGYDFAAYQWYKGGEAIEGATASYLHVPEGLDTSAEYSVALTRSDDGVTVPTCPVTPRVVDGVTLTLQQNVVPEGGEVRLTSDRTGTATLYDVSGQLVSRHALEAGDNVLPAPGSAGYYLLRVVLDNGRAETYHLQVVNR